VAGCCECGEHSGSCATELVIIQSQGLLILRRYETINFKQTTKSVENKESF
jgi:hypothetical protein